MAKNYTTTSLGRHILGLTNLDGWEDIFVFDDEDCVLYQWLDTSSPNDSIMAMPTAVAVRLLAGATVQLFPYEGGSPVATVTIPHSCEMAAEEGGKYFLKKNAPD